MKITPGRIVKTYGPSSNGHQEQVAIVTHVYGDGEAYATLVNLHVFTDLGEPLIAAEVRFYQSQQHAIAALAVGEIEANGGAIACWLPEREA